MGGAFCYDEARDDGKQARSRLSSKEGGETRLQSQLPKRYVTDLISQKRHLVSSSGPPAFAYLSARPLI